MSIFTKSTLCWFFCASDFYMKYKKCYHMKVLVLLLPPLVLFWLSCWLQWAFFLVFEYFLQCGASCGLGFYNQPFSLSPPLSSSHTRTHTHTHTHTLPLHQSCAAAAAASPQTWRAGRNAAAAAALPSSLRWMLDVPWGLRGCGQLFASSWPPPAGSVRPPDTVRRIRFDPALVETDALLF